MTSTTHPLLADHRTPPPFLWRWCGAAAAALGLVGCAGAPLAPPYADAVPPAAVPERWQAAAGHSPANAPDEAQAPTALAQWWSTFQDPTLNDLVAQALRAHTSVRSAQAALRQARALRDLAAAGRSPTVSAAGSAQRTQVGDGAVGNTWRAGLDAQWELDLFGQRRQAEAAADATWRAAAASAEQAQVSLAAEVGLTYIDLRGAQARLAIAQRNLAAQQETLQLTDWRVQAGLASSLDLEQARTATEQTRAQIPLLLTTVAQAQHALAVLTNRAPGTVGGWPAAAVPQPPSQLALSFPADTLRQRPDVRAAEHRVQAALANLAQADAARYPDFRLAGSLGLASPRWGELFDVASLTRTLLASVSASLLDGGAARAQVRAQQAAWEQARLAHESAVLTALQEVENALVALQGDRERLDRLQAAATAAANAELLARNRYASGLIDFRTVLDTQRTLLSTQSELESARASWSADHVRLYKALGGGWSPVAPDAQAAPPSATAPTERNG